VRLDVYDAALQAPTTAADLVIRTSADPLAVAAAVQAEARRLDPFVVINSVTTMDAIVSRAIAPWRFSMWSFTLFAVLAFALATVGLFSLVTLDVARRRHEFAIRLALGAQRADLSRLVLRSSLGRVVPGVALGVFAALTSTRAIRHILFGVELLDSPTYAAVVLLVLAVVTAASWLPAYRASGVDPLPLLRHD
jgi:putative ABC transport system permease protein